MISYIIPAKDEEQYIAGCLKAIFEQEITEEKEVIVVDNNCTDATAEVARRNFSAVKVVSETQPGINPARQRGYREARGDVLVFVDADVHLPKSWTRRVVTELRSDQNIAAISGPYRFYDANRRSISRFTYIFQIIFEIWARFTNFFFKFSTVLIAGDMAIKKTALDKIGGFDPRFIFYREDVDTAKRLSRVGLVVFRNKYEVFSSARRFNKMGLWKLSYEYIVQFILAHFSRNPAGKGYDAIR